MGWVIVSVMAIGCGLAYIALMTRALYLRWRIRGMMDRYRELQNHEQD